MTTVGYELTSADRAPLPAAIGREPRYPGYRDTDRARPYAAFLRPAALPAQPHVAAALAAGEAPAAAGYRVAECADRLGAAGHGSLETGWTRLADGTVHVAVRTSMPGVTAAMWDWWFGWHGRESARYKLWHPDAHRFAALGEDRSTDRSLTDRQRYVGNVSYVEEYIGARQHRLAIRFLDPVSLGFDDRPGHTHVCARLGLRALPVAFGWLVHQVGPVPDGSEVRSRFFLNDPALLPLPARATGGNPAALVLRAPIARAVPRPALRAAVRSALPRGLAQDLITHCAQEMHHLASFLPDLHAQFRDLP